MKIALVHDFLATLGGAERVLVALHELYPDAPVYTLWYDRIASRGAFAGWDIRAWKKGREGRRANLVRYPMAIESFNFDEYDAVISSSGAFAKSIITRPETVHICYCHTPARYLWDWSHEYLKEQHLGVLARRVVPWVLHFLRVWDQAAAARPDFWVANSQHIARRIYKYYRQSASVIYPPVTAVIVPKGVRKEDFFLVVGRLSPYKRIERAIEACKLLKLPLRIVGEGSAYEDLKVRARGTKTEFLGFVPDRALAQLYAAARAVLFPQEEDFGIVPIEALSAGTPVIAYAKGGVVETLDEEVAVLYQDDSVSTLVGAIKTFIRREGGFKKKVLLERAADFSPEHFKKNWRRFMKKNIPELPNES